MAIETAREKAETDSFDELGKVYNRLQVAHQVINELCDALQEVSVNATQSDRDLVERLITKYGDINGD